MSNEAADRLMNALNAHLLGRPWPETERASVLLQKALDAERKATVERIRAPMKRVAINSARQFVEGDIDRILDAEAER